MGGTGATFGQSFVNTLIQGQTIMAQVADRREHLELQKKLAAAQLQEHDVKTQLATRALTAQSDLRSRLQPQEWQGSELSPGGSAPAAPLTDAERMSFSASLDPHAAAKEMLAGGNRMSLKDMLTLGNNWVGGQAGATPPAAPTAPPAQAGPVQASEPTAGAQPAPSPATSSATGIGPTSQLEHSYSVTFDKDGQPKLELKTGEKKISLSLHHEFEPLPDGRVQNYQTTFNPATGEKVKVPVGVPQLPDAQKAFAQTAISWNLKPGTEMFAMAIAEQVAATTMYQGQAQTIALNDVREKYTSLAGGGAKGAPAASPTARAQAQEVTQAAAKTEAEALARTRAAQAAPIGDDAVRYINKTTLMHPEASTPTKDVQGNKNLVQVPPAQAQGIAYYPVVKQTLEELENIVLRRPDLFPPASGETAKDMGRVALAAAKAKAKAKTDPDVGSLNTLQISLPTVIKTFGDTGNVAIAERAIAEAALGGEPSTREQAMARIDLIRSLVNAGTARYGLPPIPRKSGPKPAEAPSPPSSPARFRYDDTTGRLIPKQP